MSSITAISVTYNSEGVISNALHALEKSPHVTQTIVVDNASTDGTARIIEHGFPRAHLIKSMQNVGFGRGNNLGLSQVASPYALLVNPDAIVSPEAIETLLQAAQNFPDAAILAPRLKDEGGKQHLSFKRNVFAREKSGGLEQDAEGAICADYLSGAVMLMNMEHMRKIGFFDPAIFLFYEDDDVCMRVRAAGFSCVYVPQAEAIHLMGASSGKPNPNSERFKQMHMVWSRLYIQQKYKGKGAACVLAAKLGAEYSAKALLYFMSGNKQKFARYRGRVAGVKGFNQTPTQAPL